MFKKIVVGLLILALMIGVFAPLVQHVSQSLAAEKPAVMETAFVLSRDGGTAAPASTFSPARTCVGWNG
jgi:hypothetical protein